MSINVYPVIHSKDHCEDYKVKINGREVALNTARVSAVPHNRRWPGHQRDINQTELVNFLSLQLNQEAVFEITPQKPFEKVVIRPLSLGIQPIIQNGTIKFTLKKAQYFTVEAYGRHHALHVFADPVSNYDIDITDKSVIYYGKGEHDAGFINLESNQTLFIDEGAVVYGCVRATDAKNIKIIGRGILDNSKNKEQILFEQNASNNHEAIKNAVREHTIQIKYCTDITIEGITIRDSLCYNIRPTACKNLHISNVKIIGCWRYNSDGIDMHNCENVLIENCFIRTFDDCICVKGFDCYFEGDVDAAVKAAMYRGGKAYDVFKNVRVRNCVLWNDWNKCLEIGAETRAEEMCDIIFEDCDIIHVTGTVLDCYNVDYADVHDVVYRNIRIEYDDVIPAPLYQETDEQVYYNKNVDYAPALIKVVSDFQHEYSAKGERRGINRDITFENIYLYSRQKPKCVFKGYSEQYCTKNITVKNLYWNNTPVESFDDGNWDVRDFAYDIKFESAFAQLDKNTVDASNQLKQSGPVRVINPEGKGKRVLLVGNSITLHGIAPKIGWYGEWGMAASSEQNDYVHQLIKNVKNDNNDAVFCICQVSAWEQKYKNGSEQLSRYQSARDFNADIIVARFSENCPKTEFDNDCFKNATTELLNYLDPEQKAKVIITTSFWHHPADTAIVELANDNAWPLVTLGDLGEQDKMKAIGLFEHSGVANHPGDLGMKAIADRILTELKKLL